MLRRPGNERLLFSVLRRHKITSPCSHLRSILVSTVKELYPSLNEKEIASSCQISKGKKGDHYQSPISFNRKLLNDNVASPVKVAEAISRFVSF